MLKKLLTRQNIYITTATVLVTLIVLTYIFTLGARMTSAREKFLRAYDNANTIGLEELTEEEKNDFIIEVEESLNTWHDPEAETFLNELTNL